MKSANPDQVKGWHKPTKRQRHEDALCGVSDSSGLPHEFRPSKDERMNALRAVSLAAAATSDLPTIFQTLLERVCALWPDVAATVRLCNPESGEFEPAACRNIDEAAWRAKRFDPTLRARFGAVTEGLKPVVVEPLVMDPKVAGADLFAQEKIVSAILVRLCANQEILGTLGVLMRQEHHLSDDEIQFLQVLATPVAMAIQSARLHEQLKLISRELAACNAISDKLNESDDLRAIVRSVMDTVLEVLHFDAARIMLFGREPGQLSLYDCIGYPATFEVPKFYNTSGGVIDRVVRTGEPLSFEDMAKDWVYGELSKKRNNLRAGFHSGVFIPVKVNGQLIGIFNFLNREPRRYAAAEMALIEAMCGPVGTAVQRANLFSEVSKHSFDLAAANELLRNEIDQRRQAEDQLRVSLHEKEVLLKEVHHRVKNNMQVVTSLVRLHAQKSRPDEEFELLRNCEGRVAAMALVHELLYESPDLTLIDLAAYIAKLAGHLAAQYRFGANRVTLETALGKVHLSLSAAIPCGLILNELIANSLKHAFPADRAGKIVISLRDNGLGQILIEVRDDGIGLPTDWDFANARSLGFELVRTLTRQLGGSIDVDGAGGTRFLLSLPSEKTGRMGAAHG